MLKELEPLAAELTSYCKNQLGFERPPKLFLKQDEENSLKTLGRTAHYNPGDESVTVFVTARHPKDILRSVAHELVHHHQNLRGDLSPDKCGDMGKNYAQDNQHLRNMEKEAYLLGNILFRDWEDSQCNIHLKESKKMSTYNLTKLEAETLSRVSKRILETKAKKDKQGTVIETKTKKEIKEELLKRVIQRVLTENENSEVKDMKKSGAESLKGAGKLADKLTGEDDDCPCPDEKKTDVQAEGAQPSSEPVPVPSGDDSDENEKTKENDGSEDNSENINKESIEINEGDKVNTPELEENLYQKRFGSRNAKLFDKLAKKWTK